MKKIPKNSKNLKNDGHFRIPHPQICLKQFSNICENVVIFLLCRGCVKMIKNFRKNIFFFLNRTWSFFYILQLPQ